MLMDRLKPLKPYLKRYWKSLAWGGVAVIAYNVLKVLVPIVIGHAIDDMRHGITQQKILFHALRLLLVAASSAVFLYITRQVIIGASREIEYDLRNDLFANLERQSPSYYHVHRTGEGLTCAYKSLQGTSNKGKKETQHVIKLDGA